MIRGCMGVLALGPLKVVFKSLYSGVLINVVYWVAAPEPKAYKGLYLSFYTNALTGGLKGFLF